MEIVNIEDKEYADGEYFDITIEYVHSFRVYTNNAEDALELLGKYCKDKGYYGLIDERPYDDILQDCEYDETIFDENFYPINGGEYFLDISALYMGEGCDK